MCSTSTTARARSTASYRTTEDRDGVSRRRGGLPCVTTLQDRVKERRRAVAIVRPLRESEGLAIAAIVDRLGRSPATVKGYFYDPTGTKARAVKRR